MVELLSRIAAGYAASVSPAIEQPLGRMQRDFVQFASDYGAASREVRTDHRRVVKFRDVRFQKMQS